MKVYIELSAEQKIKLYPIQAALMKQNQRGKKGVVLAQVLFTGNDVVAVVKIISPAKAHRLNMALCNKPLKSMMTDKLARRRLAKARASN